MRFDREGATHRDEGTNVSQSVPAVTVQESVAKPSAHAPIHSAKEPIALTEDGALALLAQPEADAKSLEEIARNGSVVKSRKVKLGLASHPRTPRHISLPLLRQLYTFDLMQVALTPAVAGDLKRAADELLCGRLATISSGERLSLARRGSGQLAGALLLDKETRVMRAALENARLSEAHIIHAIGRASSTAPLIETVCHHSQWALRREVRFALLRHEKTPMARAVEFARSLPRNQVQEILQNSRLPESIKAYLLRDLEQSRKSAGARS